MRSSLTWSRCTTCTTRKTLGCPCSRGVVFTGPTAAVVWAQELLENEPKTKVSLTKICQYAALMADVGELAAAGRERWS